MAANPIHSIKLSVLAGFFFVFISTHLKTQSEHRFSVHFESNSFNLSEQAIKRIDSVLVKLKIHPKAYTVKFIGHTDSTGSYASNRLLSLKRARQVADYFETKKFSKGKMTCSSVAYSNPLSDNSTDEKKYLNRRVEISLTPDLPKAPSVGGLKLKDDKFSFSSDKGTTINYRTGTKITIEPNSFVDKDGKPVTGTVQLVYNEYRTVSDFILAGIPMDFSHDNETFHFNSAGMFKMLAYQKGQPVYLKSGRDIKVDFPLEKELPDLNFYRLDTAKNRWNEIAKLRASDGSRVTSQVNTVNFNSAWGGGHGGKYYYAVCGSNAYPMECATDECDALDRIIDKGISFANSDIDFSKWFGPDDGSAQFSNKYHDTLEFIKKRIKTTNLQIKALGAKEKRSEHHYVLIKSTERKNSYQVVCRRGTDNEFRVLKNPLWAFGSKNHAAISESVFKMEWSSCKIIPAEDNLYNIEFSNVDEKPYLIKGMKIIFGPNVKGRKTMKVRNRLFEKYDSTLAVHENRMNRLKEREDSIIQERDQLQNLSRALTSEMYKFGGSAACCFWEMSKPYMSKLELPSWTLETWLFYFANHKPGMLSRYTALKDNMDVKCKEINEKRKKIAEEAKRVFEIQAKAQKIINDRVNAVKEQLSISGLGIYNCDQLARLKPPVVFVQARFQNQNKKDLSVSMIYLIDSALNGVISYGGNFMNLPISFGYSYSSRSTLIAFDENYNAYLFKPEKFNSVPVKAGQPLEYTFVMEPIKKLANQKALDELIQ